MKKFISLLLITATLLPSYVQASSKETISALVDTSIKFEIDGKRFVPRETDGTRVYPLIYEDTTYIPARFIAEAIGLEVKWDGEANAVFFTAGKKGSFVESPVPEEAPASFYADVCEDYAMDIILNNKLLRMSDDVKFLKPLIYKERTYLPTRYVAEEAGAIVTWDGDTRTVKIDTSEMGYDVEVPESIKEKIIDLKKTYMSNDYNGSMLPEEEKKFREKALRAMVIAGFDYVIYSDYNRIIDTFPSYAEVYTYYMKNKNNASDSEILDHLEEVYEKGIDCVELTTLTESPNFARDWSPYFVGPSLKKVDPNQNIKYIIRYPTFVSYTRAKGAVVKNISSSMLLAEPADSGSFYSFKANTIKDNYMEMMHYYLNKKLLSENGTDEGVFFPSALISIVKRNDEYLITIY